MLYSRLVTEMAEGGVNQKLDYANGGGGTGQKFFVELFKTEDDKRETTVLLLVTWVGLGLSIKNKETF